MIRACTDDDLGFLVNVGRVFHEVSGHKSPFVGEHLAQTLSGLIHNDFGLVFRGEEGAICGLIYPMFYNRNWLQCQEVFWWGKGEGLDLLEAFESEAIGMGANEIVMASLESQRPECVARLLRKRGYSAKENIYSRVL